MADTNESAPNGPGGLDDLRRQDSAFNSNRRERPPMINLSTGDIASRVPLRQPKIQKKDSKGGLRGMFSRNKTEKAVAISPLVEEAPPLSGFSERSMRAVAEASLPRSPSAKMAKPTSEKSAPVTEINLPATPAKSTIKSSRMNLRSKSVKSVKTPSKPTPKSPSTTKSSPRPPTRTSAAWDPPPLFQAYPQAIKHAQLSASTLSADAILRMSNHTRNNSLRDEIAQVEAMDLTTAAGKKAEKAKSKHKRQISGSLSKADWIQKIFVLVTSGYLLQYAGEGSFDRLPEKMMQLGKDSVAFASDVIPGKHWVLQISQAMDSDGTPASDSRSLLSRLAFRGADYRRSATSLLLVLDSAEDMDSWIAVVRREIEALGGKKHYSETGKPKADEKVMQLRAQPSHRYLIHRSTDELTDQPARIPSFGPPPWVKEKDNELQQKLEEATSELIRPQSSSIRPSTGHHSIAGSVTSNDGRQLESLRNSSNRFSYVSSGQRTLITSQDSSPSTSPTRESASFEDMLPKSSTEETHLRPNAAAVNERRRSMQTMQVPVLDAQATSKLHRHSTYGGPPSVHRSRSPGLTPNFSVPNSSIKRYSIAKSPTPPSSTSTTPPIPSTPVRDPIMKGTRKTPPSALHVPRSLSPVKASPGKAPTPMIFTNAPPSPTHTLHHSHSQTLLVQNAKPSMITIPPRSPSSLTPTSQMPMPPPRRMSSLTPLAPHESVHIDFHLPRRYSSMQTLREASEKYGLYDRPGASNGLDAPLRTAPLPPPAALETPLPSSPFVEGFEFGASVSRDNRSHPQYQSQFYPQHPTKNFTPNQRPRSKTSTQTFTRFPQPTPTLVPMPVLANTKSKVKRPISMQIAPAAAHRNNPYLSSKVSSSHHNQYPNQHQQTHILSSYAPRPFSSSSNTSFSHSPSYSPSPFPLTSSFPSYPTTHANPNNHIGQMGTGAGTGNAIISPGLQRVKEHELSRTIINRRSMPTLVGLPPPAPPPDCALPPLPPPGSGASARGSVGSRGSVSIRG